MKHYARHPVLSRAFSLIEAAIVLGVVGLIIGGIWVAAAELSERHKINETVKNIGTIANNIRSLYVGMPNPTVTTNIGIPLISSGAIPAEMVQNSAIVNAWGGAVSITIMISPDSLRFMLYNIPISVCSKLVMAMISNPDPNTGYAPQGMMRAMVDTNNVVPGSPLSTVSNYCILNTGGVVRFYYTLRN